MITPAEVTATVSLAALATAVYGIFERGSASRRAERIRLTTVVENLIRHRQELVEYAANNIISGDAIEVVSAALEVSGQQAFSLLQTHQLTITSSECREIAQALDQSGFENDAEAAWLMAQENGQAEGLTQELHANRGFAYFLFRFQREDEARELLADALARYPHSKDRERLAHVETLRHWINCEILNQGLDSMAVKELSRRIDEMIEECSTPSGKQMASQCAFKVPESGNSIEAT